MKACQHVLGGIGLQTCAVRSCRVFGFYSYPSVVIASFSGSVVQRHTRPKDLSLRKTFSVTCHVCFVKVIPDSRVRGAATSFNFLPASCLLLVVSCFFLLQRRNLVVVSLCLFVRALIVVVFCLFLRGSL